MRQPHDPHRSVNIVIKEISRLFTRNFEARVRGHGLTQTQWQALAALAQDCIALADWMLGDASVDDRLAGSVPYLQMCAVAVAGWQMHRQASEAARRLAAGDGDPVFLKAKQVTARFFMAHIVPEAAGLKPVVMAGADLLYALSADELAA